MDTFLLRCTSGRGSFEFFDRFPADPDFPIERFWLRVSAPDFVVAIEVDSFNNGHPAPWFAEMAARWRGWPGELLWESLEGEIRLRSTQDRAGHVSLMADLHFGHMADDWSARAAIKAEAGQLEALSRRAVAFFGQPTDTPRNHDPIRHPPDP